MDQVIERGTNDAMQEIHDKLKQLTVLNEKKRNLDDKIAFQNKTEDDMDNEMKTMSQKVRELELKARQKGISLSQTDDDKSQPLRNPEEVTNMKKKIEMHSLNAIHRKFYAKILRQKEALEQKLHSHNETVALHKKAIKETGGEDIEEIDTIDVSRFAHT